MFHLFDGELGICCPPFFACEYLSLSLFILEGFLPMRFDLMLWVNFRDTFVPVVSEVPADDSKCTKHEELHPVHAGKYFYVRGVTVRLVLCVLASTEEHFPRFLWHELYRTHLRPLVAAIAQRLGPAQPA